MIQSIENLCSGSQVFLDPMPVALSTIVGMAIEGFGLRIASARRKAKLTQTQCADLVGRTKQNWSHYETERQQPSFEVLDKFCRRVGVSTDYIITGKHSYVMPPDIADVCLRLHALSKEKLEAVITLIASDVADENKVLAFADPSKRPK